MNNKSSSSLTRRKIMLCGAIAGVATLATRSIHAETPALSVTDPMAAALGYVEDANAVDTAKWPKKAGTDQNCFNCGLYKAESDDAGLCSIFAGKLVKGAGWCNAWVPKPG